LKKRLDQSTIALNGDYIRKPIGASVHASLANGFQDAGLAALSLLPESSNDCASSGIPFGLRIRKRFGVRLLAQEHKEAGSASAVAVLPDAGIHFQSGISRADTETIQKKPRTEQRTKKTIKVRAEHLINATMIRG
jgi:hypothetical protein